MPQVLQAKALTACCIKLPGIDRVLRNGVYCTTPDSLFQHFPGSDQSTLLNLRVSLLSQLVHNVAQFVSASLFMSLAIRDLHRLLCGAILMVVSMGTVCAQVTVPSLNQSTADVHISSLVEEVWKYEDVTVRTFRGGAELRQGVLTVSGQNMVVFDRISSEGHELRIYVEGGSGHSVRLQNQETTRNSASETLTLKSTNAPVTTATDGSHELRNPSTLIQRAAERLYPERFRKASPVSLQVSQDPFIAPQLNAAQESGAGRRIRVRPRSSQPLQFELKSSHDTVPEEQVYVITGGVNVLIEGIEVDIEGRQIRPGVIDLSADRVVLWTERNEPGLQTQDLVLQPSNARLQLYMEGNILIRHKQNTVTATHAFFDANNDRALLLNAELRTEMPTTKGVLRVRAERLRQLSANRFHAQNAWTTTSPYGKPGYRIQASDIFVEPGGTASWTGVDPLTGRINTGASTTVTALNSQFMVGDVPILWLPRISGPAEDPGIPIRRATVKHDRIFGLQAKTVWNLTKLLGADRVPGMQWDLMADYMTERGPGVGLGGQYDVVNQLGRMTGGGTIYNLYDNGLDNLGADRNALVPDGKSRGEITWRHKQQLPADAFLFGEIGYLSDRNYLESYHEQRFDEEKDVETILGARQDAGSYSGMLWARPDLNQFEATTQWLPRADLYSFSRPLLNGMAYWSSHTSAGYANLDRPANPTDPNDPFTNLGLPYIADRDGAVLMTRHEVDAPFMLGPVNIDPYVMGEAAYWDQGLIGNDIDRYVLNAGVRARLFATKIMPFVRSGIFNLHGLAHKSEGFFEYSYTDSSRDLAEIAQYNEIDDNSQERFRSRYTQQIFPGLIPAEFDPRFYAVRNGAGLWVAAPYHELVDDQQVMRFIWRNRLQTKAGPANQQRIRDWMVWETGVSYFPEAARDNFGEELGLIFGNYRWNISDRTSVLTDAIWDVFENAQNNWSVGVLSQRSTRGSVYLSYRQVNARNFLDSQTLIASYSYRMSPKWISTASTAFDVAENQSRGSSLTISRVGLDWILHVGLGFDSGKDNVGVAVSLEPRFGPPSPTNLGYLLGLQGRQ